MRATLIQEGSVWRSPEFISLNFQRKLFYRFMFDAGPVVSVDYLREMSDILSMDFYAMVASMLSWCRTNRGLVMHTEDNDPWLLGDIHDLLWQLNENAPEKVSKPFIYKY